MNEIMTISKIAIGGRISLTTDVCKYLNVGIGDKVTIIKDDFGQLIIKNTTMEA